MKALVTGAGSGIGRDVVSMLVGMGYEVWALGRRQEALLETAQLTSSPDQVHVLSVDVASAQSMKDALGNLRFDVLVANAGVCKQASLDDPNADEVWREVMSINVDGVWNTFRSARLNDNGRAVVVSSGLGKNARAHYTAYTASKHAVLGMTKCFALELAGRGIRVNAVCPGWVDTSMSRADLLRTAQENGTTPEAEYAAAIEPIALKRFVMPDEVAQLIGFLVSDASSAITGQSYNISCGEFFG
jgi:NAD(P)-dependent dehydrogenase (short-subunit alcohol dehydrogenase family)